jgi:hypothetical protein
MNPYERNIMDPAELLAYVERTLVSSNEKFNATCNTPDDSRKVSSLIDVIAELQVTLHQVRCDLVVPAPKKSLNPFKR